MNKKIKALRAKYKNIENERFFSEIFDEGIYADALNQKADVVVDIGALAGEFSAYIYDKAKVIYAIEMFSEAYKELTNNIKEFGLDKIKPYNIAIGPQDAEQEFSLNATRGGHLLADGAKGEKVIVKTLRRFMKEEGIEHIDVLKIDIENLEPLIFASEEFKEIAHKISYIIGEHHGTNELESYGFKIRGLIGPVWSATNEMKPKIAIITRADEKNMPFYEMFKNSIRKFHSEKQVDIILIGPDECKERVTKDPAWFYRASPILGKENIDVYDLILLMDCDQIVMGSLDHIFNGTYDVGTVLNINRVDPSKYGAISFQGLAPNEYFNNGLVAVRNTGKGKAFLQEWDRLCHSIYFDRFQYREQDVLNILTHYGDYDVRCFDHYDQLHGIYTWNGLVSKGEWHLAVLHEGNVYIPRGKDGYPDRDIQLKIVHWAGGAGEAKMNYKVFFSEEVSHYIDWLVKDTTKPYEKA